jgi:xanthine dehydrogenase accessory factor
MDCWNDTIGERAASVKDLYARLSDELAGGREAAVVSLYRSGEDGTAAGGGVRKYLCSEGNPLAWAWLADILGKPGVVCDGPVAYIEGDAWQGGSGPDCTRPFSLLTVERYLPKPRMIILGGGHIALALAKMAKLTDFCVTVFDDRPAFANPGRFPDADEVICDDFSRVMERVNVRPSDYVVIVTRGHKHDTECLEGVLAGVRPAYTGMIGSRRRVAIVMKQLEEAGYSKELLEGVHSPIGLRISAVTPAEISIAILAEIIQVKRAGFDDSEARHTAVHDGKFNVTCDIEIAEWLAQHGDEADALLTILTTKGPVPRETGAKMAISYEGRTAGTIGGGCAESDVMQDARTIIRQGGWMTKDVDMTDSAEEDGMVCGGRMTVVIEKAEPA